jgi:hypothetical protein
MNRLKPDVRWRLSATRAIFGMLLALASVSLGACAGFAVSDFDQASADRTVALSRNIYAAYQELLSTPADKREALVSGDFAKQVDAITTGLRVHLLQEQARPRNKESAVIAADLLTSWEKFSTQQRAHKQPDHLADITLQIERTILTRELRAALVAEQAKKPGSGGAQALAATAAEAK